MHFGFACYLTPFLPDKDHFVHQVFPAFSCKDLKKVFSSFFFFSFFFFFFSASLNTAASQIIVPSSNQDIQGLFPFGLHFNNVHMRCKTFQVISLCFPNPISQHRWRVTTTLSRGTKGLLFSYFYISTVHLSTPWWQAGAQGRSLCVQMLRGDDCAPAATTVRFPSLRSMTKWARHGLYASCATWALGAFSSSSSGVTPCFQCGEALSNAQLHFWHYQKCRESLSTLAGTGRSSP